MGFGTSLTVDNIASQIGWSSAATILDQGFGFNGPDLADLGVILPAADRQSGWEALVTGQQWSRFGLIGSFDLVYSAGPRVTNVLVNSADWSPDYKAIIPGADQDGYSIPHGGHQTKTLPWSNIREVIVEFDRSVEGSGAGDELVPGDFQLSGINSGSITIQSPVAYDDATNRTKLTLAANLQHDRYLLKVDATKVSDSVGSALDGEFTSNQLGPSGNGSAGGDFWFDFSVMPADFNRNGDDVMPPTTAVDSSDLNILGILPDGDAP